MVKKIRASGANVLLVQKSILRDAVTDLSLHYLVRARPPWPGAVKPGAVGGPGTAVPARCCQQARRSNEPAASPPLYALPPTKNKTQAKAKIMVVRDIEREDIEFLSKVGLPPPFHRRTHAQSNTSQPSSLLLCAIPLRVGALEGRDTNSTPHTHHPLTQTLHCLPISHVDHMRPDKLGHAALVEELDVSTRIVCFPFLFILLGFGLGGKGGGG